MADLAIAAKPRGRLRFAFLLNLTLLGLLLLLWLVLSVTTDSFMTANNIVNLLRQGSLLGDPRDRPDLRHHHRRHRPVGRRRGRLVEHRGGAAAEGRLADLGRRRPDAGCSGLAIGAFHGFGIVKLGLPPFIITLATLTSLRGIGLLMTNGATITTSRRSSPAFRACRCWASRRCSGW